MSECLVTKLKASVDDDSLLYFGKLSFQVTAIENPTSGTLFFEMIPDDGTTGTGVSFIGGGGFGANNYTLINGNYKVVVPKYNLLKCRFGDQTKLYAKSLEGATKLENVQIYGIVEDTLNISVFSKMPNLKTLETIQIRAKLEGDTNSFNKLNLNEIGLYGATKLTGDVVDFGHMTNLTRITFPSSGVDSKFGGDLLGFVRKQIASGRASGSVTGIWWNANGLLTFNGETFPNAENNTISWTSTTATLVSGDTTLTANV